MSWPDQVRAAAAAASAVAIIDANAYMTIASADADGVPWASTVWLAHRRYAEVEWSLGERSTNDLDDGAAGGR